MNQCREHDTQQGCFCSVGADVKYCRHRADHCRTLAKSVTDNAARKTLIEMAADFDAEAERLEAENRPQIPPEQV